MEEKNLYDILEISEEERKLHGEEWKKLLNKRFRQLSLKYHPDRHVNDSEADKKAAEERFKEIAAANDILSDETKREQYDNGGNPFGGADGFAEFMKHFHGFGGGFGGFNPFGDFGGMREQESVGDDAFATLHLKTDEAFNGGRFKVTYYKQESCTHCGGTGSKDGRTHRCSHCNGTGFITQTKRQGNFIQQTSSPCPYCHGTGKEVSEKCPHCNGTGMGEKKLTTEYVDVPGGVANGMQMKVPGAGHAARGGGRPGDLIVRFEVQEDDYFKRVDDVNVVHTEYVNFVDCMLGFEKEFRCLDGSKVKVKADECTPDGKAFVFKGKGFPHPNYNVTGDYAVVIKYKIPTHLSSKQKEELEKIKNIFI